MCGGDRGGVTGSAAGQGLSALTLPRCAEGLKGVESRFAVGSFQDFWVVRSGSGEACRGRGEILAVCINMHLLGFGGGFGVVLDSAGWQMCGSLDRVASPSWE